MHALSHMRIAFTNVLCRKSRFKKQNGVIYGSGVNFNTGYIMMDLFNFGAKSTQLNVISTGCSKLLQLILDLHEV